MADVRFVGDVGDNLPNVVKKLLFFTILMVTFPLGAYFTSKIYLFEGMLAMTSTNSYFYAAIVAICAVHIVLGLFVYVAWTEDMPPAGPKLIEKRD